ncbi:MAG: HNH endonuclease signature motif containing protein [Candidatus Magasanikiibacteriota bacterium]
MSRPFNKESFDQKWKEVESGCWEWQATRNQDGYGRVKRMNVLCSAHRVSYELYVGPLQGLHVLHKCDNPCCVNPAHLFLGTHKENQEDKAKKKRGVGNSMPGVTHPAHKLTEEDVREIKSSLESSKSLMQKFNVSQSLILLLKANKRWKHITV